MAIPDLFRGVFDACDVEDTSARNKDVDATKRLERRLHHAVDIGHLIKIRGDRNRLAAALLDLLRDRAGGLGILVDDDDVCTFLREAQRHAFAKALSAAGDDRRLAFQPHSPSLMFDSSHASARSTFSTALSMAPCSADRKS